MCPAVMSPRLKVIIFTWRPRVLYSEYDLDEGAEVDVHVSVWFVDRNQLILFLQKMDIFWADLSSAGLCGPDNQ